MPTFPLDPPQLADARCPGRMISPTLTPQLFFVGLFVLRGRGLERIVQLHLLKRGAREDSANDNEGNAHVFSCELINNKWAELPSAKCYVFSTFILINIQVYSKVKIYDFHLLDYVLETLRTQQ